MVRSQALTLRHSTSKMLVYEDGSFIGTVGGGELENRVFKEAEKALNDGKSRLLEYNMADPARGDVGVCGGTVEVFAEPILPAPTLVVIGGGQVGKAVAHLARWLDFRVAVSDDRPEFVTPEANPDANNFYECKMQDLPKQLKINNRTYLVLTTRGVVVDAPGLPSLLESDAAYIGVIGSRRRWKMTVDKLKKWAFQKSRLPKSIRRLGWNCRPKPRKRSQLALWPKS